MNSGPVMPARARYSQIACVMAAMWSSLKDSRNADPRWPDVPNVDPLPGLGRVGVLGVVGGDQGGHVDQVRFGGLLARPFVRFHAAPPGR